MAAAVDAPQLSARHWMTGACQTTTIALTNRQLVALLGLWEREETRGMHCRALAQAAQIQFGLPTPLSSPESWNTSIGNHTFDVTQLAQQIFCGRVENEVHTEMRRTHRWARWAFSLEDVWKEDALMHDRPIMVHCSGLGGGLLSPDHDYDLFLQNHAPTNP
jgi:hypothetical protein